MSAVALWLSSSTSILLAAKSPTSHQHEHDKLPLPSSELIYPLYLHPHLIADYHKDGRLHPSIWASSAQGARGLVSSVERPVQGMVRSVYLAPSAFLSSHLPQLSFNLITILTLRSQVLRKYPHQAINLEPPHLPSLPLRRRCPTRPATLLPRRRQHHLRR